jgi:hypothetical protein
MTPLKFSASKLTTKAFLSVALAWYPFSWQLALPLLQAIVLFSVPKKLGERHLPSFATISDGIASGAVPMSALIPA